VVGVRAGAEVDPSPRLDLMLSLIMGKSIRDNTKRGRGRPVTTGKGTLVGVRLQPALLRALDVWIEKQDAPLTRPEAIRAMMETILHILSKDAPAKKARTR
jgi:hypothetical protein